MKKSAREKRFAALEAVADAARRMAALGLSIRDDEIEVWRQNRDALRVALAALDKEGGG